jgi:hypothetical protein
LAWANTLNEYYYISGAFLIGLGIFIGFFGNKNFNLTMSLYSAMFGFVLVMTLASWWTWLDSPFGWILILILASVVAFTLGKLALKIERIGMWMINLGTAFYSSCLVYDIILFTIGYESFALLLSITLVFVIATGI